jgi:hypothetical protein
MALQDTVDAADVVTAAINAAIPTMTESTLAAFSRVFVPEFDADELSAPKGEVFPAGLNVSVADRSSDNEDSVIEIGIGRVLTNETTDIETHLLTVEEIKDVIRPIQRLVLTNGNTLQFLGLEVTLFVPELFKSRVCLSIIRARYRGFS